MSDETLPGSVSVGLSTIEQAIRYQPIPIQRPHSEKIVHLLEATSCFSFLSNADDFEEATRQEVTRVVAQVARVQRFSFIKRLLRIKGLVPRAADGVEGSLERLLQVFGAEYRWFWYCFNHRKQSASFVRFNPDRGFLPKSQHVPSREIQTRHTACETGTEPNSRSLDVSTLQTPPESACKEDLLNKPTFGTTDVVLSSNACKGDVLVSKSSRTSSDCMLSQEDEDEDDSGSSVSCIDVDEDVNFMEVNEDEQQPVDESDTRQLRCCRQCHRVCPNQRRSFCVPACLHLYQIRSNARYVRQCLLARDQGVCDVCGLETERLRLAVNRWLRNVRHTVRSQTTQGAKNGGGSIFSAALDQLVQKLPEGFRTHIRLNRRGLAGKGQFWHADHILAVCEGGGESGLEGYRTLCVPCHRYLTAQLRKPLKNSKKISEAPVQKKPRSSFGTCCPLLPPLAVPKTTTQDTKTESGSPRLLLPNSGPESEPTAGCSAVTSVSKAFGLRERLALRRDQHKLLNEANTEGLRNDANGTLTDQLRQLRLEIYANTPSL